MPSTQTPPLAGTAIDPPGLRPPIDDASIERVDPPSCTRASKRSKPRATRCCSISARSTIRARAALRRRLSSSEVAGRRRDAWPKSATPSASRVLCGCSATATAPADA